MVMIIRIWMMLKLMIFCFVLWMVLKLWFLWVWKYFWLWVMVDSWFESLNRDFLRVDVCFGDEFCFEGMVMCVLFLI